MEAEERRPLEVHRRRRLLTIRALADKAGISTSTVVAVEKGHKAPRFGTMHKIADALGLDPMEIAEFAEIVEGPETGKAAARNDLAAA